VKRAQLVGAAGALLAMSGVVVHTSSAAFKATTSNAGNNWAAGTVELSDDDGGAALFAEPNLVPDRTGTKCIVVTYTGSTAAKVRLSAKITGGHDLGQYLDLTVSRGTGGDRSCTGFQEVEADVYAGTLAGMATAHPDFVDGAGTWDPVVGQVSQSATYRFVWKLQDDDDAQGLDVGATFTWDAKNS